MTSALDAVLDRALLGYSAVGYGVRSRAARWDVLPEGALTGRTAIVTGAGAGLGKATAEGLARLGAEVRMVVRDEGKGAAAREEILARVPQANLAVDLCDVSSLASVRAYASTLTTVDVLVHNAGVMPAERTVTDEGHEACLATHVLGPHLMTRLALPALRASGAARVIWVSSGGMYAQRLTLDDLEYTNAAYRPTTAYARTKRMQVALAREWGRRLAGEPVAVHSCHPGWADTPGVATSLPGFRRVVGPILRTPEQGADTLVWLAAAPEAATGDGRFWHDRAVRPEHYVPWTRESAHDRSALFDRCDALTGSGTPAQRSAHTRGSSVS